MDDNFIEKYVILRMNRDFMAFVRNGKVIPAKAGLEKIC